jgi:hypothetical protein
MPRLVCVIALLIFSATAGHATMKEASVRKSFCLPVRTRGAISLDTESATASALSPSVCKLRKVVAVDFDALKAETECNVLEERLQRCRATNISPAQKTREVGVFLDLDHTALFGTDGNDLGIAWQVRDLQQ